MINGQYQVNGTQNKSFYVLKWPTGVKVVNEATRMLTIRKTMTALQIEAKFLKQKEFEGTKKVIWIMDLHLLKSKAFNSHYVSYAGTFSQTKRWYLARCSVTYNQSTRIILVRIRHILNECWTVSRNKHRCSLSFSL